MDRYISIHGHFYQPPRENPWLEAIELQDSAYPYHDWNARIDSECYAPNSASRILDASGRIEQIVNNYAQISFNFGPTLLQWMEQKSPETYRAVIEADRQSRERFSGHGSAIAQCYHHMIMPLANSRDKATQVLWGIRDFEHRFGRRPEGMWLPETAVDLETLDLFARQGIRFTILSPYQARRVRHKRRVWRDVTGGRIDPTVPYRLRLPSRREISVFFYDGPASRSVAFERLLDRGEDLAGRLVGLRPGAPARPRLAHIATDGETYGHHHFRGEMALSYALKYIEDRGLARITNYGEFLDRLPAEEEVDIYENTSWSCEHGVERWRAGCGCSSGGHPGWNQEWRAPLRAALDWLRDCVAPFFDERGRQLFPDPWAARDAYIGVLLDRQPETTGRFLTERARRDLNCDERIAALKLMELQRHAMLMYTSCGWFFDELSGIETVQVIQYAGRVLQLARELGGPDLEPGFLERLELARSNIPEHRDGRLIYEKFVRLAVVDLAKVGVHYAISRLFEEPDEEGRIYSYSVDCRDYRLLTAGKAKLALGTARVTSLITQESLELAFGVAHLGDQNVSGGIRTFQGQEQFEATAQQVTEVFQRGDYADLIRTVDREFPPGTYSLKLLFRDEQRKIMRQILEGTLADTDAAYRQIYRNHVSLMRFLAGVGMPAPRRLEMAAEVTLNSDLRRALEAEDLDAGLIAALVEEARIANVPFDTPTLEFSMRRTLERMADRLAAAPEQQELLDKLDEGVVVARALPFEVALWHVQNVYHRLLRAVDPAAREARWMERFRALGEKLLMRFETAASDKNG